MSAVEGKSDALVCVLMRTQFERFKHSASLQIDPPLIPCCDGGFPGAGKQAYRIGVEKDNLNYLEEFSRGEKKGTIFNVDKIQAATRECERLRTKLNKVRGIEKPLWPLKS
jgi:hypothetical protein